VHGENMKFFVPGVEEPDLAEEILRDIVVYTRDATGWEVQEDRIYSIEYDDGGHTVSACVGGTMFGETIECILNAGPALVICTVDGGVRFGPPIILDRRIVLECTWFDSYSPERIAQRKLRKSSSAPNGTVTFLFTDIEGSTRLWERSPELMRSYLAAHDEIVRDSIERCCGVVFKTVGDAFCAAFHSAPDALSAALDAQYLLTNRHWEESMKIRVRMAVHTGEAELIDQDYIGPSLNKVSRLLSAAHGDQILMSEATCELCLDALPDQASLMLLGEYALKDITRPERVYQLVHPELPSQFPMLRGALKIVTNENYDFQSGHLAA